MFRCIIVGIVRKTFVAEPGKTHWKLISFLFGLVKGRGECVLHTKLMLVWTLVSEVNLDSSRGVFGHRFNSVTLVWVRPSLTIHAGERRGEETLTRFGWHSACLWKGRGEGTLAVASYSDRPFSVNPHHLHHPDYLGLGALRGKEQMWLKCQLFSSPKPCYSSIDPSPHVTAQGPAKTNCRHVSETFHPSLLPPPSTADEGFEGV